MLIDFGKKHVKILKIFLIIYSIIILLGLFANILNIILISGVYVFHGVVNIICLLFSSMWYDELNSEDLKNEI